MRYILLVPLTTDNLIEKGSKNYFYDPNVQWEKDNYESMTCDFYLYKQENIYKFNDK